MSDTSTLQSPEAGASDFDSYVNNPAENTRQDMMFVAPPRTFQGKKLFPYSEGERLLMLNVTQDGDHGTFWLLALVYTLIRLQELYDKALTAGRDADTATDLATEQVMLDAADKPAFRAQIIKWSRPLKRKDLDAAVKLASDIYEEANSTELKASEAADPSVPGK